MDDVLSAPPLMTLNLKHIFDAPIEHVFAAWTNTELLAEWFGPENFTVTTANINLQVGGKYLLILQSPEGKNIEHSGKYVEINPPTKLIFTWLLADQACGGCENQLTETLVSIHFKPIGRTTEIMLTHERLPSKEACAGHEFGWNSSFNSLKTFLLTVH